MKQREDRRAIEGIQALRDHNPDGLKTLYDLYGHAVYSLAYSRLHDAGLAEEVTQDVFFKLWKAGPSWDATKGSFRSWLFTIARHATYDRLRTLPAGEWLGIDGMNEALLGKDDPSLDTITDLDYVESLMRTLPGEQQHVLKMIVVKGHSVRETASHLGVPEGTVKSRLRLALNRLRIVVSQEEHRGTL